MSNHASITAAIRQTDINAEIVDTSYSMSMKHDRTTNSAASLTRLERLAAGARVVRRMSSEHGQGGACSTVYARCALGAYLLLLSALLLCIPVYCE